MTRLPLLALALTTALSLTACGGGDDPTVAAPSGTDPAASAPAAPPVEPEPAGEGVVVLRGDGLTVAGSEFAFGGANLAQVRPALEAAFGGVEVQEVPCPAGARTAVGSQGFDVLFDGETMVGWDESGGRGPATADGLALGSTRADVEAALPDAEFTEDTLGPEFLSPTGLGGFLDGTQPTSVVVGLTGGEQCVQR